MNVRVGSLVCLAVAWAAVSPGAAVRASNTSPAIVAFDAMFAGVNDYTYVLRAHEIKGTRTQDRTYSFAFLRPSYAKSLIVEGEGKGGGAVWDGGSQVNAHAGGLFAGLHAKIDINDPRAVSLRGFTTPAGLIQNFIRAYKDTPGTLAQTDGGPAGAARTTDRLDLKIADPASYDGVTESILYLDAATHWPVRQIVYEGSQIVMDQQFSGIRTNVGLKPGDFPF